MPETGREQSEEYQYRNPTPENNTDGPPFTDVVQSVVNPLRRRFVAGNQIGAVSDFLNTTKLNSGENIRQPVLSSVEETIALPSPEAEPAIDDEETSFPDCEPEDILQESGSEEDPENSGMV